MLHLFASLVTLAMLAAVSTLIAAMLGERREAILVALGITPIRETERTPARRARVRWQAAARPMAQAEARRAA